MIRYYLLHFGRNLLRQKWFSIINLLGLSVSITCTILIYLYVGHEMSYDGFHPNTDRLYRVNQTFIWSENRDQQFSRTGPGVANAMKEELPEVEMVTSLHTPGNFIISYTTPAKEVIRFEEDEVFAADTNFFKIFNFPLIKGDAASAFRQANTLMMTRSTAKKYFKNEDPIGKLVRLGGSTTMAEQTFEVIGVVDDTPDNSTIQFDVLLSMKNFPIERLHWSWVWTQLETFVLLRENVDIQTVREKLTLIPRKRASETLKTVMGTTYDEYVASGKKWELFLQPINTLHLPVLPVVGSFQDIGNIKTVYSFIGAAVFIILLSCINFMNLSTAQFTRRIKEASVRKILGLGKKELSISYFFEAVLFCLIALVVALTLTQLLLPQFNQLTGKSLTLPLLREPSLLATLITLTLLMATVSSIYPAFFLSKFHPVEAIKGKLRVGKQGGSFRNGLVIFQFSVSIVLIACTAIVFQQLTYVSEKDLGFDKENLLEIEHAESVPNAETLAKAITSIRGIISASWCSSAPPRIFGGDSFSAEGLNGLKFSLNYTSGDENYLPTLGLKFKIGRNFLVNNQADTNRVIVNESALKRIGWDINESVIGKKILYNNAFFEVIGVVSDFNYWSLDTGIEPMAIFNIRSRNIDHDKNNIVLIRVQPQNSAAWQTTLDGIHKVWKQHAANTPLEYGFIDEQFADTFKSEAQFGKVLILMASLAILIACLGLLGMIIFALEQRTKEIGIRKISGASVWQILKLISSGYTKLIVIAFIIGTPLSYWMMHQWLQDFAYRITPSPWIFIITGLSTLVIAILITSYHSIKSALTNPVDVLKEE
jgi:putative ABC transport system permease protein